MEKTYIKAQKTFKYFWRELSWEKRRIVPSLDLAMVKVAFKEDEKNIEYMWIDNIYFDGTYIQGVLINEPNSLTNIKNGDKVTIKLDELCDWIFAINREVYGAFTVNLIRSEMSEEEREEHDKAWGLNFGNPNDIKLVVNGNISEEHPMSLNMTSSLIKNLKSSNDIIEYRGESKETMLHYEALAGNTSQVKILLEYGIDIDLENINGMKAIDLAKIMQWNNVIKVIEEKYSND